ncbi:MAG: response regulator [Methylotenera sp.]|nr:response regulator [Methylotenera sp.]
MSIGHNIYPANFKALVAIEALKGNQNPNVLAERFGITTAEIAEWCEVLLNNSAAAFRSEHGYRSEAPGPIASRLSSDELAQTIVENSTQGFAMMDDKGYCIYANQTWLDMTGYTTEEITSRPLHDLVHHHYPDGRPFPMAECPIDRALPENFTVRAHQDIFFRKDGTTFDVMCAASPIFDSGKPVATIIEIRDITAQKALETTLIEETQTLEILNESAASIASTLDLSILLQLVTDASTKLSGAAFGAFFYTSMDVDGEELLLFTLSGAPIEAFRDFGNPRATAVFGPTFRGEGPIRVDDILQDPRYGKSAPHYGMPAGHLPVRSFLSVPVIFPTGEVLGGLFFGHPKPAMFTERHERLVKGIAAQAAIAVDNARLYKTAQKAAEERARLLESERAARQIAEQQNKAKDMFLAMLGHELRNPLHAISTSLELLELSKSTGNFPSKAFDIIQRQSGHLTRMVDDLLDASRMLSGKLSLNENAIRLDTALKASIETLNASGKTEGYNLDVSTEPVIVMADSTRIDQIFTNLIGNSLKYSPKGSTVIVKLLVENGQAIVVIKDQGVGIAQELQTTIFEPFVQGPRSLGRAEGGLGMGLTIVKTLVTLHNGSIEVSSEGLNKGSVFTVKLPSAEEATMSETNESQNIVNAIKKIVVIEDNEDALDMLVTYLNVMNVEVTGASNGNLGLNLIKTQNPDLAIIDIGLPDVDGYEIARRLRSNPATSAVKLIALTGYGSSEDAKNAITAGFDIHLTKPVNMQQLLQHINNLRF